MAELVDIEVLETGALLQALAGGRQDDAEEEVLVAGRQVLGLRHQQQAQADRRHGEAHHHHQPAQRRAADPVDLLRHPVIEAGGQLEPSPEVLEAATRR